MNNLKLNYNEDVINLIEECQEKLQKTFKGFEDIALFNQQKVLNAFSNNSVGLRHFAGTTGYGYDDIGRDTLCKIYADVFRCENAIVSPHILSGTHALTVGLFGLLRPNDVLLSVCGSPYDTMLDVINGENNGSLKDFGVKYSEIDFSENGKIQIDKVKEFCKKHAPKVVYAQRSRGYSWRNAITIEEIKELVEAVKSVSKDTYVFVDNCYGEFTNKLEPTDVGADVVVGSLIKNAGGGIAPTGAYIAGTNKAIELIGYRLTSPSVGMEIGSYQAGYQYFYQGLFMAPHITIQAMKCAMLFSAVFQKLGYKTLPIFKENNNAVLNDIICSIEFDTEDKLVKFVQNLQYVSPIDSNVTPMAWDMPGYNDKVIMAAGCFVQGASIELSGDSPIRKPYIAYVQGALTYEHAKIAVLKCAQTIMQQNTGK